MLPDRENIIDSPLILQHRLTVLGESLRPVWQKLNRQIDAPVTRPIATSDMVSAGLRFTDAIQRAIGQITVEVNALMSDIVANEAASDGEVHRAVGRLEARLDDLLSGYREIRALNVEDPDEEARRLLAGAYRHVIVDIGSWLQEAVEALTDPATAARKRGIPTTGNVELRLTLTLTSPPQCAELLRWIDRRKGLLSQAANVGGPSRSGFGWLLGLAAILAAIH